MTKNPGGASARPIPAGQEEIRMRKVSYWLAAVAATVSLVLSPVHAMVTIEVVIFSFAALYGFGVWPVVPTAASVAVWY